MANHGKGSRYRHRRSIVDLAVIASGTLFLFLLLVLTGLHKSMEETVGEGMLLGIHFDELLLVFIYLGAAFAVFSVRRQRAQLCQAENGNHRTEKGP